MPRWEVYPGLSDGYNVIITRIPKVEAGSRVRRGLQMLPGSWKMEEVEEGMQVAFL